MRFEDDGDRVMLVVSHEERTARPLGTKIALFPELVYEFMEAALEYMAARSPFPVYQVICEDIIRIMVRHANPSNDFDFPWHKFPGKDEE